METIEFSRIESVRGSMPGGIGGMIRYTVDAITEPDYADCLDLLQAKTAIQLDINVLAAQGVESGDYISSFVVEDENEDTLMVAVRGTYMVVPDYRLLRRIVRWKHNYNSEEHISLDDFREVYGPAFGEHFHAKWISLDRDILKMIAYFADDIQKGQDFIGMIMRKVFQYEKRTKATKRIKK